MPFIMSSTDPGVLYIGTYRIYRNPTAPYGTWYPISPDLTDGINNKYHVITTIAESPLDTGILYVGTSDGNVVRRLSSTSSWENIYSTLPNRYVTSVKASPNFTNSVFVSHSGYRDNDFIPHIHKSTDNGSSWIDISGDLPQLAVNDVVILDGYSDEAIFAATDGGVYFTSDGGLIWSRVGNNMPVIPVYDIEYDNENNHIIAGTFGRSMWSVSIDSIFVIVGISQHEIKNMKHSISLYPVPATTTININNLPENIIRANIVSLNGQVVKVLQPEELKATRRINISNLNQGIYFLIITTNQKNISSKFVVVR